MSGWREVSLSEVAPYWTGKVEAQNLNEENFISADNMLPDKGGIVNSVYAPTAGKSTSFKPKDILVSNIRPYFKKIWFANKIGGCSNDVIVFRSTNVIVPRFMYYCLSNDSFFDYMMSGANGTKMPRGNKQSIPKYKINLPPLPTQQKIAKILSNYDDLIENNLKRIKLLEESARLTYEEWFLRFRIDGKKLDIDPESGLPFGWLNKSFGDVFNINNGYAFKSGDYAEHGVPILRTRDYSQTKWIKIDQPIYISEELSQKYTKYYVQEYDLMLIMVGASIGNYGVVLPNDTGLLQNQNQWAIRVNNGFEKYIFYKLLMMEDLIKNLLTKKTGAARDFFRASFLKELDILLPDEDTVTLLNKTVQPTFEEINNLQHQNQLLKEARDILLPRLMTGMIDTDELAIAI